MTARDCHYATLHESFLSTASDDRLFSDFFRAGTSAGLGAAGSAEPEVKMSSSLEEEPSRTLLIMLHMLVLQQECEFRRLDGNSPAQKTAS